MAMIDQAYSIEMQRIVNLLEAEQYYREGKITSQTAFTCIGMNCDFPMTCANLSKPLALRKRDPYFRIHGREYQHSLNCGLFTKHYKGLISGVEVDTETEQQVSDDIPDVFDVERPARHDENLASAVGVIGGKPQYIDGGSNDKKLNHGPHNYHHLGTLVDGYLNIRKMNRHGLKRICIEGRTMTYGKLFKRINRLKKPLDDNAKYPRFVYFSDIQKAQQLSGDGGVIVFLRDKCDVSISNLTFHKASSAIVITRKAIESYRYKRDIIGKIELVMSADSGEYCAYLYASPELTNKPNDENSYVINFIVDDLNLLEFKQKSSIEVSK
jgi:hypothetical protein